jgi:hypothetical protein
MQVGCNPRTNQPTSAAGRGGMLAIAAASLPACTAPKVAITAGTCIKQVKHLLLPAHTPQVCHLSMRTRHSSSSLPPPSPLPAPPPTHILPHQVQEHPVPNVSALPLDDDIFTWHGNGEGKPQAARMLRWLLMLQWLLMHHMVLHPSKTAGRRCSRDSGKQLGWVWQAAQHPLKACGISAKSFPPQLGGTPPDQTTGTSRKQP